MKVYVLYDQRRPEQEIDAMHAELARQGIEYEAIWSLHFFSSTAMNINLAHKLFVRLAQEKGLPEVCILEADAMFPSLGGWRLFLEHKPKDFDIYLAGTYGLQMDYMRQHEHGVYPITSINGLHCYIIRAQFYDTFLSLPADQHIDVALDGLGKYFVCYPFAAIQRPGWSANARGNVNYNANLLP